MIVPVTRLLENRPYTDAEVAEYEAKYRDARRDELEKTFKEKFRPESDIHKMGYRTKLSVYERRRILAQAVQLHGLRHVAEEVATPARVFKGQRVGPSKYKDAIASWERDLLWLKVTFRDLYSAEFPDGRWPSTEPY